LRADPARDERAERRAVRRSGRAVGVHRQGGRRDVRWPVTTLHVDRDVRQRRARIAATGRAMPSRPVGCARRPAAPAPPCAAIVLRCRRDERELPRRLPL